MKNNTTQKEFSAKTKPNKDEKIVNLIITIIGFTLPLIITFTSGQNHFGINYNSFITAIIVSIVGLTYSLKSRSMLFFTLSFLFTPIHVLTIQAIEYINI